ncbi:MAG: permease [Flavobacteriales bacterium]|nr:permease [Candidatus Arcticimaribacter sp.]
MKILDRYILSSYIQRLLSVFIILMLIFIIQTIWLFIDEFAGKGIDIGTILRFLLYYSPKLVPLVLPLSVLLASIMTYGTFAENYEFAAMKSTGISLQRAMLSLVVFHFFLGIGSFYFTNYIMPFAEVKSFNLRRNLAKLKPALAITEGVFNDLGQMNIKVDEKYGDEDRLLRDIIIHEKIPNQKNNIVIKAAAGELKSVEIGDQLQLWLFNGNRYEEVTPEKSDDKRRIPHSKVKFEKYIMNIDLSEFNNVDLSEENYKTTFRMQKVNQLNESIDSLEIKYNRIRELFAENFKKINGSDVLKNVEEGVELQDSIFKELRNPLSFITHERHYRHKQVIHTALMNTRGILRNIVGKKKNFFIQQKLINLHKSSFHDKFTLGFGVFFLFLVGAALGAIIRKGGLGLPVVLAILIFLSYHYIGLFGKNAAEDSSISPFIGSWVSVLIIGLFALYLTKQASRDRGIANLDRIIIPLQKVIEKFKNFKNKATHAKS